jgi:hypothetical protein
VNAHTQGPFVTPFGFYSTAAGVIAASISLASAIVTGGAAGGGCAPYAVDPGNAERLWNVALGLIA